MAMVLLWEVTEWRNSKMTEHPVRCQIKQLGGTLLLHYPSLQEVCDLVFAQLLDLRSCCFFKSFPDPEFIIESFNFILIQFAHNRGSVLKAYLSKSLSEKFFNFITELVGIWNILFVLIKICKQCSDASNRWLVDITWSNWGRVDTRFVKSSKTSG